MLGNYEDKMWPWNFCFLWYIGTVAIVTIREKVTMVSTHDLDTYVLQNFYIKITELKES